MTGPQGHSPDSASHGTHAIRAALEELAIRTAMTVLRQRSEGLQTVLHAMHRAAVRGTADSVLSHSRDLHRTIIDAANNMILSQMWVTLEPEAPAQPSRQDDPQQLVAFAESHRPVVDFIAAGDVEAACLAIRAHYDGL